MRTINKALHADSAAVGRRWGAALRRRYDSVKDCARAYGVDVRTAEAWFAGQAPLAKIVVVAAAIDGPSILAEVFMPDSDAAAAAIFDATLDDVVARIDALSDEIARLRGGGDA